MSTILLVTSSPRADASYSTKVARALVATQTQSDRAMRVIVRDLAAQPLPHIGPDFVAALALPQGERSTQQAAAIALSDEITSEVLNADILVIASAMINFGISSTLKTWFDYLVRGGVTFRYTEKGPEGLVQGKKAYLVQARGGVYSQGPMQALNFQEPYLKSMLAFIGITDVESILVEGVAYGPEMAERAFASAIDRASAIRAH